MLVPVTGDAPLSSSSARGVRLARQHGSWLSPGRCPAFSPRPAPVRRAGLRSAGVQEVDSAVDFFLGKLTIDTTNVCAHLDGCFSGDLLSAGPGAADLN